MTHQISPDDALERLLLGNRRYVAGLSEHPRSNPERREELRGGQSPFAVVLCCSDSRVSPELIFDQGLGDLFVMRVAGNIAPDAVIGSIEYAVEHLGSTLVVVMGHSSCGAVSAAVSGYAEEDHIKSIVAELQPAVEAAAGSAGDAVGVAARANAGIVAESLRACEPLLAPAVASGRARVVAAYYDLESGAVELLG